MLERKTIINRIITDNHKIVDRDNLLAQDIIKEEEVKKDNSFDQLLSLQLCIQKHSGLKELCKFLNI